MPEEKRKRGRPPKNKEQVNISESAQQIKMQERQDVTVNQINSRLHNIFTRMNAAGLNYSSFKTALNRAPLGDGIFNSNPFIQNQRIKKSNQKGIAHTKKEIQKALDNPENNEELLRESSVALYYQNYVYSNLLKVHRDIPQYFNYIVPRNIDKKELKSQEFIKEKNFVQNFTEKFDIPLTFKNVTMQVSQEGKASYVFRSSHDSKKGIVDFALLQKLPPSYVKYTGYGSDSPLICSFNFMMFLNPVYDIDQWPKWMGDIWNQLLEEGIVVRKPNANGGYTNSFNLKEPLSANHIIEGIDGTYAYWVELPQDLVWTFGSDFSSPLAIPEYVGLFADLSELESYKWLQTQTMLTNITNILTAEVPTEKDAIAGSDAAILSPEVILGLEGDCSSALNSNIFPFFAPLENFKMHSVDHIPNASDITLNALRNVINTAGAGGLIATTDKPSIAMIKATQYLYESRCDYLTLQYEKFLNLIINKYLGLKYNFKCNIWGGVYSWRDEIKTLKELIQNGNIGFMPKLLSAYRMTIDDYKLQYDYVDILDIYKKEVATASEELNKEKSVGKPPLEEGEVEDDNTAASKEQGGNVTENKE